MKLIRWSVLSLAAIFLVSPATFAHGEKKVEKKKKAASASTPAMDEQAMMEAFMKVANPGEAHKKLEPFIGNWDVVVRSWMAPGAPVNESRGTAENSWILGGRYVEQRFHGSFMDQPFEGLGYTGYDNIKKKYVSSWMDSMSTASMSVMGSMDASGKLVMTGTMDDPMTGKAMTVKEISTIVDNDHNNFEMWTPGPDGKMFKMMEIRYVRKK